LPDRLAVELDNVTDIPTPTPHDKTLAVFISIPLAERTKLATAGKQLTKAYRDINESETIIDQLGFYTYRTDSNQVFVFNPNTPSIDSMQPQSTFGEDGEYDFLPDRLEVVVDALNNNLPTWVTPKIGPWWLGAFGLSSAVVCRLVMPGDGKLTRAQNLNTNVLEEFIQEYSDESYLLQAIVRHRPTDLPRHYEYSVSVRIALFGSEHQARTESELYDVFTDGRPRNPTDLFAPLGVSSNWDAFADHLYRHPRTYRNNDIRVKNSSSIRQLQNVIDYVTGVAEWDELLRERYVGADVYDHVCDYTQLMAREADLQQLFTLAVPSPSPSPWRDTYGRDPSRATELKAPSRSGKQSALELADKYSDPPADIADKERSSPNDGSEEHWTKIKITARIFREQGYKTYIIDQDTGSRPDLWIQNDDGEIFAVEVECTSPSKPANALSNLSRTALWGYPVIIVAADKSTASTISSLIAKPFSETDGGRTRLYSGTRTISDDGKELLVEKGNGETEWWATPDRTRQLIIGGKMIAETPLDAPFDEPDYPLPRLRREDGQYIVENPDGSMRARYQTEDRFQEKYRKLWTAYIPVDLSYFPLVDSLRVLDDNQLVEYHPTAEWETPSNSERHEKSHDDAFNTLTIDKAGSELDEPPVRRLVSNWIAAQTHHGPPARNIFGQHRKEHTTRSRHDDRAGANRFYTDKAYRYPRGLVAPGQKGLRTTPQFPEKFEIAEENILQEPVIPDVESRASTYDSDTE